MVQKLFSIYTQPEESHPLHIEVGAAHLTCWCTGNDGDFTALEYFTFTYDNTEGGFIDVFRELKRRSILLSNQFPSQEIVWENANFMCIPNNKFDEQNAVTYLSLVNSQSFQSAPMHQSLEDYTFAFTADSVLYKIITQQIPGASHSHKVYKLLQQNSSKNNSLHLQFYQSHFILTAFQNGALQLATVYRFSTPHEAVYHILNTLDNLGMSRESTLVFLSGFIDEASPLYKEIYLYISNFQFTKKGKINNEYPAHYFTTYHLPVS